MTLGVTLIYDDLGLSSTEAYANYGELAQGLEGCGISVLWLTEHHHNSTRISPSIPLMMAHLGTRTRLRLGAATVLLSLQDPLRIAEEMAVLENLYPERLIWGFAKGGGSEVRHNHLAGIDTPEAARAALRNHLGQLLNLRAGGTSGVLPLSPVLSPAGRYFIATRDPQTVAFAAQHDLGLMIGHKWRFAEMEALREHYQTHHPRGEAPEMMVSRFFHLGESVEAAADEAVEMMRARHDRMRAAGRATNHQKETDWELLKQESLIGNVAHCHGMIKRLREMGVTHLSMRPVEKDTAAIGRSVRAVTKIG